MLPPETKLSVDLEEPWPEQDLLVLRAVGEIDIATVDQFREILRRLADLRRANVVIDASGVTFMDSTGLHALIEGKRAIHNVNAHIVLVCSPQVRRILELMFPERLFADRVDTLQEALAVINRRDEESIGA